MDVSVDQLSEAISRITTSGEFPGGDRMVALLTYLVNQTTGPSPHRVTGYMIGVDVLGRSVDFDPNSDAIVRVYMGRLRKALTLYYATEGQDDPIRFHIPRGRYEVQIERQTVPGMAEAPAPALIAPSAQRPSERPPAVPRDDRPYRPSTVPSVAVLPLRVVGAHPQAQSLAIEIADEVARKLSIVRLSKVFEPMTLSRDTHIPSPQEVHAATQAAFVVMGSLRFLSAGPRVILRVIDCLDNFRMIWTMDHDFPTDAEQLFDNIDAATTLYQTEIRLAILDKAKTDFEARGAPIETDADLLLHALPNNMKQTVSLADYQHLETEARRLMAKDPTPLTKVVLATTIGLLSLGDPPSDTPERLAEAAHLTRQAIDGAPRATSVLYAAAISKLLLGRSERVPPLMQRILDTDPWHPGALLLSHHGHSGPAPRGAIDHLIAQDRQLSRNSSSRGACLAVLTQGLISIGAFDEALPYAQRACDWYASPHFVYRLAACLLRTGEAADAFYELKRLKQLWPNLSPRHFANFAYPRLVGAPQTDKGYPAMQDLAALWERSVPDPN